MEMPYFIGRIFYWLRPHQDRGRVGQEFQVNLVALPVSYFIGHGPDLFYRSLPIFVLLAFARPLSAQTQCTGECRKNNVGRMLETNAGAR